MRSASYVRGVTQPRVWNKASKASSCVVKGCSGYEIILVSIRTNPELIDAIRGYEIAVMAGRVIASAHPDSTKRRQDEARVFRFNLLSNEWSHGSARIQGSDVFYLYKIRPSTRREAIQELAIEIGAKRCVYPRVFIAPRMAQRSLTHRLCEQEGKLRHTLSISTIILVQPDDPQRIKRID